MPIVDRRSFIEMALSIGATAAWAQGAEALSSTKWIERRELYPEGVASGDPEEHSVLLWTRRPNAGIEAEEDLILEVSCDPSFERVVVHARAPAARDSDWTCRVLVGGLEPGRVYWYRFSDRQGFGSRVGRTRTAPLHGDVRPARFVFISSCATPLDGRREYKRILSEDEGAAEWDQIHFVLHAGEFLHAATKGGGAEQRSDSQIPTKLSDYRAMYRASLQDAGLQEARARWPFVSMRDRHVFPWAARLGRRTLEGRFSPAGNREVAASQAFFEYQPARISRPGRRQMDRFRPQHVLADAISHFELHRSGEPSMSLAGLASFKGHRRVRWGRHIDLIVTEQRANCSEGIGPYDDDTRHTVFGADQKMWLLDQLQSSTATWKIWGNAIGDGTGVDLRRASKSGPTGMIPLERSFADAAHRELVEVCDFVGDWNIKGCVALIPHESHELRSHAEAGSGSRAIAGLGERSILGSSMLNDVETLASRADRPIHHPLADMGRYGLVVLRATKDAIETDVACGRELMEHKPESVSAPAIDWAAGWRDLVDRSNRSAMVSQETMAPS